MAPALSSQNRALICPNKIRRRKDRQYESILLFKMQGRGSSEWLHRSQKPPRKQRINLIRFAKRSNLKIRFAKNV